MNRKRLVKALHDRTLLQAEPLRYGQHALHEATAADAVAANGARAARVLAERGAWR
jgi:hypothetical protein